MGRMFYIGLYRENHEKIFLSETLWLKPRSAVVECLTRDREARVRVSLCCGPSSKTLLSQLSGGLVVECVTTSRVVGLSLNKGTALSP